MSRNRDLSDDTNTRIIQLVENSAPNLNRHRMSEEIEKRLADVERRTAACYASIEDLRFKIGKLIKDIEKGPPLTNGKER